MHSPTLHRRRAHGMRTWGEMKRHRTCTIARRLRITSSAAPLPMSSTAASPAPIPVPMARAGMEVADAALSAQTKNGPGGAQTRTSVSHTTLSLRPGTYMYVCHRPSPSPPPTPPIYPASHPIPRPPDMKEARRAHGGGMGCSRQRGTSAHLPGRTALRSHCQCTVYHRCRWQGTTRRMRPWGRTTGGRLCWRPAPGRCRCSCRSTPRCWRPRRARS
jgi:hypothetical protein